MTLGNSIRHSGVLMRDEYFSSDQQELRSTHSISARVGCQVIPRRRPLSCFVAGADNRHGDDEDTTSKGFFFLSNVGTNAESNVVTRHSDLSYRRRSTTMSIDHPLYAEREIIVTDAVSALIYEL